MTLDYQCQQHICRKDEENININNYYYARRRWMAIVEMAAYKIGRLNNGDDVASSD